MPRRKAKHRKTYGLFQLRMDLYYIRRNLKPIFIPKWKREWQDFVARVDDLFG